MRLYRCRLDMRACHPASDFSVTGPLVEVSKPHSRVSREQVDVTGRGGSLASDVAAEVGLPSR